MIIGLSGAPGVGKSTVAELLAEALRDDGHRPVVIPMDGFHLANAQLSVLGLAERKGAPETFDADGFVALLRRIRAGLGRPVYAPRFHRDIEESIAAEIAVGADTDVVVVEGNYLLLDTAGWCDVQPLLDLSVHVVASSESGRVARLVARHVTFGRSPEDAAAWVAKSDEANARLVEATRQRADLEATLPF